MRAALTVFLLVVAVTGVAWLARELSPVSETPGTVEFEVLPGWGASRVAAELEDEGIVRNGRLFSLFLRLRGLDRSVGEGLYDLDPSQRLEELAQDLVAGGRPRVVTVLVPEGVRAAEVAERLDRAGLDAAEGLLELVREPGELRPSYVPEGATLEGYLFPASYELPLKEEPEEILGRFLERFEQELDPELMASVEESGFTLHEWVILASMVQAEAGGDEEMPVIAGVFLNRLALGMLLQSDPTVAFGLGKSLPELDPLAGDMRSDHPWNTYTRPGLPQGPISNPGSAALRSLARPVRTDERGREYLYFLHAIVDGEPLLRVNTTLEGHNRDIDRYLR